jgi:hypothetical protein
VTGVDVQEVGREGEAREHKCHPLKRFGRRTHDQHPFSKSRDFFQDEESERSRDLRAGPKSVSVLK